MNGKTSVYIINAGHNVRLGIVDTAKLAKFSFHARTQLSRGGSTGNILPNGSVTLPSHQAEGKGMEKALCKVVGWIDRNDVNTPHALTAEALGIEEFPDFVYVYRATMILRIDRTLRSDSIRDDIISYVRSAPLRFDEFAMLLEVCNFDTSLGFIVKNTMMEFKVKGGVPDMAKIEGYAQLHGMFEELTKIEKAIASRMESEKKAAGENAGGENEAR